MVILIIGHDTRIVIKILYEYRNLLKLYFFKKYVKIYRIF